MSFRKLWQRQRLIELPFLFPPRPKYPILLPFAALVPEHLATPSARPVHLSPELADPYPCHRPARAIETDIIRIRLKKGFDHRSQELSPLVHAAREGPRIPLPRY